MDEGRDYSGGRGVRVLVALATLASGALLAAVIAWWVWELVAPAPLRVRATAPADPAATLIASGLFGGAPASPVPTAASATATWTGDAHLLGILAARNGDGYALFRLPSGAKLVAPGEALGGGVTLVSIARDAVTLRVGASERRLALWPEAAPPASRIPALSAPRASTARNASCAPPAGFAGPVIRLNAELLGGLGNDPAAWSSLLEGSPAGLTVRANGGYAAMLGLVAGDRIELANGVALHSPADVTSAVLRPIIDNQGVLITGSRAGVRRELWIASAACAG